MTNSSTCYLLLFFLVTILLQQGQLLATAQEVTPTASTLGHTEALSTTISSNATTSSISTTISEVDNNTTTSVHAVTTASNNTATTTPLNSSTTVAAANDNTLVVSSTAITTLQSSSTVSANASQTTSNHTEDTAAVTTPDTNRTTAVTTTVDIPITTTTNNTVNKTTNNMTTAEMPAVDYNTTTPVASTGFSTTVVLRLSTISGNTSNSTLPATNTTVNASISTTAKMTNLSSTTAKITTKALTTVMSTTKKPLTPSSAPSLALTTLNVKGSITVDKVSVGSTQITGDTIPSDSSSKLYQDMTAIFRSEVEKIFANAGLNNSLKVDIDSYAKGSIIASYRARVGAPIITTGTGNSDNTAIVIDGKANDQQQQQQIVDTIDAKLKQSISTLNKAGSFSNSFGPNGVTSSRVSSADKVTVSDSTGNNDPISGDEDKAGRIVGIIFGIIGAVAIIGLAVFGWLYYNKRKHHKRMKPNYRDDFIHNESNWGMDEADDYIAQHDPNGSGPEGHNRRPSATAQAGSYESTHGFDYFRNSEENQAATSIVNSNYNERVHSYASTAGAGTTINANYYDTPMTTFRVTVVDGSSTSPTNNEGSNMIHSNYSNML